MPECDFSKVALQLWRAASGIEQCPVNNKTGERVLTNGLNRIKLMLPFVEQ